MEDMLTKAGFKVKVKKASDSKLKPLTNPAGSLSGKSSTEFYVPIPSIENAVGEMLESYSVKKDICVIGPRGSGKSVAVRRFAQLINTRIEPVILFKVI